MEMVLKPEGRLKTQGPGNGVNCEPCFGLSLRRLLYNHNAYNRPMLPACAKFKMLIIFEFRYSQCSSLFPNLQYCHCARATIPTFDENCPKKQG